MAFKYSIYIFIIHENPVVAAIVYEPQQHVYSSAIDYYDNRKGLVTITYLE